MMASLSQREINVTFQKVFWELSPEQQTRANVGAISEDPNSGEWLDNDGLGNLPERHSFIEDHYEFPELVARPYEVLKFGKKFLTQSL